MRTHGVHGGYVWVLVALAVVFAAVLSAGCGPSQKAATQVTATETASSTSTAEVTSTPPVVVEPTSTPPVEPTVTPNPPATLPYKPGPNESGTNYAYVKKLVLAADGYVYATVDYVIIGEGPDGVFITNDNPKLRTFPLAATCPCRYLSTAGGAELSAPLTPTAYRTKWASAPSSSRIRKNPYKLTVKHGVITKFDNAYLP